MGDLTSHRDDLTDLRELSLDVAASPSVRRGQMSAREAAAALAGIASWIVNATSLDVMQGAATALASHDEAWTSSFRDLPSTYGMVDQYVCLFAVVCRGLLDLAGSRNLRAALSFWAVEREPSAWMSLLG